MPEQPNVIGGPGVAAYQQLYDTVNALLVPLGLTGANTVTEFLAALALVRDQQGA